MGALALYISDQSVVNFQPMNINFGLIPPLGYRVKGKRNKNAAISQRALEALDKLNREFPAKRADYLERYRAHCVTLGRRVSFQGPEGTRTGTASGVDGSFALLVSGDDGREHTVNSGTVTML